jgi:surface antigen
VTHHSSTKSPSQPKAQVAAKVSTPTPNPNAGRISALQADIASLRGQLDAAGQGQAADVSAVEATQQQLQQTQEQIATMQKQLNALNAKLAPLTQHLATVDAQLHNDRVSLSNLITSRYALESSGLNPDGFGPQSSSGTSSSLTAAVASEQKIATHLRAQLDQQLGPVNNAMAALLALDQSQQAQQAAYNQAAAGLTGEAAAINAQIAADQAQIVALQTSYAGSQSAAQGGWVTLGGEAPFGFGSRFDAFPWGQCTWYVASLRNVTWTGDAWAWAGNAAAQGHSEGMTPRVGAIVVWGAGNGYSGFGHVAYVAAVNGPSDFVVNEANYSGLGVVDQRHITTLRDVEAFIY